MLGTGLIQQASSNCMTAPPSTSQWIWIARSSDCRSHWEQPRGSLGAGYQAANSSACLGGTVAWSVADTCAAGRDRAGDQSVSLAALPPAPVGKKDKKQEGEELIGPRIRSGPIADCCNEERRNKAPGEDPAGEHVDDSRFAIITDDMKTTAMKGCEGILRGNICLSHRESIGTPCADGTWRSYRLNNLVERGWSGLSSRKCQTATNGPDRIEVSQQPH